MSRETERLFSELQKAMETQKFQNEEEVNEFMDKFILQYDESIVSKRENDAYDYLEMAQNAFNKKEAIRYAQKALKLDSYCLDADLLIAQAKSDTLEEMKKRIEKVILKGEEQLIERNISKDTDAGCFYGIFETRPYMRVRKEYLELLVLQGRYRHAIREAEELIRLNEDDNLGIRYLLMSLYCYFEEEENAKLLFEKYTEDSAFMLLPIIALFYKTENIKKMKSYIRRLKNKNPELPDALELLMETASDEEVDEILQEELYTPFSLEEVVLAFSEGSFLYLPLGGFLDMVYDEVVL